MAEQVEPDVAERDVLLQLGGVRDPLAESLGEHERVVAEAERVRDPGVATASVATGISGVRQGAVTLRAGEVVERARRSWLTGAAPPPRRCTYG